MEIYELRSFWRAKSFNTNNEVICQKWTHTTWRTFRKNK